MLKSRLKQLLLINMVLNGMNEAEKPLIILLRINIVMRKEPEIHC